MSYTVSISNGNEFFSIPLVDLEDARREGFYLPHEKGQTIVSDGNDIFEVSLADAQEAVADGFNDLLAAERDWLTSLAAAGGDGASLADLVSQSTGPTTGNGNGHGNGNGNGNGSAAKAAPLIPVAIDTHDEEEQRRLQERMETLAGLTGFAKLQTRFEYWWEDHRRNVARLSASYGTATMVIGLILIIMALIGMGLPPGVTKFIISSAMSNTDTPADVPLDTVVDTNLEESLDTAEADSAVVSEDSVSANISDAPLATPPTNMSMSAGFAVQIQGEYGGRTTAGRKANLSKYGGTLASEQAVNNSLKWLVRHQLPDGSWHFNHTHGQKDCDCDGEGNFEKGVMGSTGLVLMTFLGAGHTYLDGEHHASVKKGIDFLVGNAKPRPDGSLDFRSTPGQGIEGIYEHGICTTALCEALGLTRGLLAENGGSIRLDNGRVVPRKVFVEAEKQLAMVCDGALKFLYNTQEEPGGGWGYNKGQQADTSILGWQLMALISAKNAGVKVPQSVFDNAHKFLDSVSLEGGAFYGYRDRTKKASTTGIGLLCRMYYGWNRDAEGIKKGVAYLSTIGPSKTDLYFNYYATQTMHHWGGEEWKKWNMVMREQLISTQQRDGHERGSWNPKGIGHGERGGRLFATCLSTMTLEVYYRHLPIYRHFEDDKSNPAGKPKVAAN
ncbi:MAG: hypothetical protein R3C01_04395 [Planctomycetaceae bacterium]